MPRTLALTWLAVCLVTAMPAPAQDVSTESEVIDEVKHDTTRLPFREMKPVAPRAGGRLLKHARYYWLLLAESHLTRRLFASMLRGIAGLPSPAG